MDASPATTLVVINFSLQCSISSPLPDLFAEQRLDGLEDEPDDEGQSHHVDVQVAYGQRLLAVDEQIVRVLRLPHGHVRVPNV